jgi:biotin carboxyl carrier protein
LGESARRSAAISGGSAIEEALKVGDIVHGEKGRDLEAMKMENVINAPFAGQ